MKKFLLTKIRDKNSTLGELRTYAQLLSEALAFEVLERLPKREVAIETSLQKTQGHILEKDPIIIPILRSGLAMLPAFLTLFPLAKVGFLGMRRDEETFQPKLYYQNLPQLGSNSLVIVLDPMIATGGSGALAMQFLKEKQVDFANVHYVGMCAAPEGLKKIESISPKISLYYGSKDEGLNLDGFIYPGLGDFGDRFFGTL